MLVWEPPAHLILSWHISADWKYDPSLGTEVEVRFIADGEDSTRVELEHRHLDRYEERRDQMRAIFDSPDGWGRLLQSYAREAVSQAA